MSFKERLKHVGSAEELHEVMRALRTGGSANWTRPAAEKYVPVKLHDELDGHFDTEGNLKQRDRSEPLVPGETDRRSAQHESLSVLVAAFHGKLRTTQGRVADSNSGASGQDDRQTRSVNSGDCTAPASERTTKVVPTTGGGREQTKEDLGIDVDSGFFCPICEHHTDAQPLVFRGTKMCRSCVDLLRY